MNATWVTGRAERSRGAPPSFAALLQQLEALFDRAFGTRCERVWAECS